MEVLLGCWIWLLTGLAWWVSGSDQSGPSHQRLDKTGADILHTRDPAHIGHHILTCPGQIPNMLSELSVVIWPRSLGQLWSIGLGQRSYHRSSCRCVAAVCGTMQLSAVTAASQLARSSESSLWRLRLAPVSPPGPGRGVWSILRLHLSQTPRPAYGGISNRQSRRHLPLLGPATFPHSSSQETGKQCLTRQRRKIGWGWLFLLQILNSFSWCISWNPSELQGKINCQLILKQQCTNKHKMDDVT